MKDQKFTTGAKANMSKALEMEFNSYIAQQRPRPGPIGDLARAYGDDGVYEDTNGEPLEILMRWLDATDAGPEAFQAAKDVWAEWRVFYGSGSGAMACFLRKLSPGDED